MRDTKEKCECLVAGDTLHDGVSVCMTGGQAYKPETSACVFKESGLGCSKSDGTALDPWDCDSGKCQFQPPPEDTANTIFIAVLAAILVVPFVTFQMWIFENWLMPPTAAIPGMGTGTYNPLQVLMGVFGFGGADAGEEAEDREIKTMEDEEMDREVENETLERIANLKIQREEVMERLMQANFKMMKFKKAVRAKERKPSAKREHELHEEVREWQTHLRHFDKQHGFGKDGKLRKGGLIDQFMGTTPRNKLKKKIRRELEETHALLDMVAPMTPEGHRDWYGDQGVLREYAENAAATEQDRHTVIYEQHRLDRLSNTAKQVYLLNAMELDEASLEPVKAWKKGLGWGLIAFSLLVCSVQVMTWSLSVGKETANAWLAAFIVSLFQDFCVFIPAKLFIQNLVLPMLVQEEVRAKHDDLCSSEGILYKVRFASGAAERVAVMDYMDAEVSKDVNGDRVARTPLQVSQLIVEANHLHSLTGSSEVVEENAVHRRKRLKKEKMQRHNLMVHGSNQQKIGMASKILLVLIVALLVMPADIQDFIIETVLPMIWGGWVLGMDWLWNQHFSAAVVPCVIFFTAYVIYYALQRRKRRLARMATKSPPGPIEALLEKILRSKKRSYIAETSGVAITGAGLEHSVEFAADDVYAPPNFLSTNPLLVTDNGRTQSDAGRLRASRRLPGSSL
jgi:hypothetical protein